MTDDTNTDTDTDTGNDSTSEFYTHTDWEYGHPCPSCGNEQMHVIQISGEKYLHRDGDIEHVDWTEYRDDLQIECDECATLLLRHPAMDGMNAV